MDLSQGNVRFVASLVGAPTIFAESVKKETGGWSVKPVYPDNQMYATSGSVSDFLSGSPQPRLDLVHAKAMKRSQAAHTEHLRKRKARAFIKDTLQKDGKLHPLDRLVLVLNLEFDVPGRQIPIVPLNPQMPRPRACLLCNCPGGPPNKKEKFCGRCGGRNTEPECQQSAAAECRTPGCGKPSWNGEAGQPCSDCA
jgi:hypothetical protein